MTKLVFIVSRSEPKQYLYLKHFYADEHREVILDRRAGERRRNQRPQPMAERRRWVRRHYDIARELESPGWALVRRVRESVADAELHRWDLSRSE
jgi:hypothetical protein